MFTNTRLQQYYEQTFQYDYSAMWLNSPFKLDTNDIADLCYYRAIGCFYNQDEQSIIDRRELLFSYLRADFGELTNESALVRYRSRLPIHSMIPRVLRNICNAYNYEPRRIFSSNTATNERLNDLYSTANITSILQDIYAQGRLYGTIAVRPLWLNGKLKIQVLTPDKYYIETDEKDLTKAVSMYYPSYNEVTESYDYHYWNETEFRIYNSKKMIISEPNQYKQIPFVFLRFGYSEKFNTAGMFENIEKQLFINKLRFLQQLNVTFQGLPIGIAVNGQGKLKSMTPDKIISVEDIREDDGKIPPSLEFVTPEQTYIALQEYIEMLEKNLLRENGIPQSQIDSGGGVVSGISRVIERQELIEKRQSDINVLADFERDLANMIVIATSIENKLLGNLGKLEFSIDYDEERMYLEPDIERVSDFQRMNQLLLSPINYIKKWGDFDTDITESDLIKEFENRKILLDKLFKNNSLDNTSNESNMNNENDVISDNNSDDTIETQKDNLENKIV